MAKFVGFTGLTKQAHTHTHKAGTRAHTHTQDKYQPKFQLQNKVAAASKIFQCHPLCLILMLFIK